MKRRDIVKILTCVLAVIVGVSSCSEDNGEESTSSGNGTLSLSITDAPFPADTVEAAYVTIDKIEIRQEASDLEEEETEAEESEAADDEEDNDTGQNGADNAENAARTFQDEDNGSFITVMEDSVRLNLLDLQNGVTEQLAELEIEQGAYDLIRLYVSEASVVLKGGTTYDMKVPSGAQTGIKVFVAPAIEVEGGLTTELMLDFDVSKSFVARGNMDSDNFNGFIFKPTLRAVNLSTAGRISGEVSDSTGNAIENAHVWVEQDSIISSSYTEADGMYALIGLPAETYTLKAASSTSDTVVIEGVEVTAANSTEQNIMLDTEAGN